MTKRYRRNKFRPRRPNRYRDFESLEARLMLAVDWRNPVNPFDVNQDNFVSPIDALQIINELNEFGSHTLAATRPSDSDLPMYDVSGDNFVAPIDVLQVVNVLIAGQGGDSFQLSEAGFVSEFDFPITLGQTDGARNYRLALDAVLGEANSATSIDDVFNLYLLDPDDQSATLLDQGSPGTPLFSRIGERTELATGLVRFDGDVIDIDLSSLGDLETGLLRLQYINGNPEVAGQVSVRPLSNEVDVQATPGTPVDLKPSLSSIGGTTDLSSFSPLSDPSIDFSQVRFDSTSGLLQVEVSLEAGETPTGRNVALTFPSLTSSVELRNRSGTTSAGVPYVNLQPAIPGGGLSRGMQSRSILLEFDNPSRASIDLTPTVISLGENQAPVIPPIGNLSVMPGDTLSMPLSATDADGDRVTFSLQSDQRLPNGHLSANGTLTFSPAPSDIGTYQFDVLVSDGRATSTQEVTLQVEADPVSTTRVSGTILDVNQMPLSGMQVEIGAVQGLTMSDGTFTLDLGSGPLVSDTLKIRGELFSGSQTYPFIAEKLPLVLEHDVFAGVNNVIDRPIYLPVLDTANGMTIDPAQDTTVTTSAIPGAAVMVSAGTLMNQQGTPFTGSLSITEVPRDLTPAALPRGLSPDLVVTIQPGEMVFASPAPLSLPNRAGYAPGRELDLWSINPVSGEFEIVGRGRVTTDGSQIETVSGGIRNSSWHMFTLDDDLDAKNKSKESASCGCDTRETNSRTELYTGTLLEDHTLPSYQVMGQSRSVRLVYDSLRADPKPLLQFGFELRGDSTPLDSLPSDAEPMLVSNIAIGSNGVFTHVPGSSEGTFGMPAGQYFWTLSNLSPTDIGSTVQFGMQTDMREAPTGIYDYLIDFGPLIKTNGMVSGTTSSQEGKFASINSINGPLGSGWGVAGARRLMEDDDGSVIIIDGDGSEYLYRINEDGTYTNPAGDFSTLVKADDGSFEHRLRNGGREINRYLYSADQRQVEAFNAYGLVQTIWYQADDVSRIDRIIDELSQETRFDYSASGKVSRITDPTGRTTDLTYYETGELKEIIEPEIDGERAKRTFMYDDVGRMTGEITPRGFIQETTYDEFGRVVESKRADGTIVKVDSVQSQILRSISSFEVEDGQEEPPTQSPPIFPGASIAKFTDGNGVVESVSLDRHGLSLGSSDLLGRRFSIQRGENSLPLSVTDGKGNRTDFTYDDFGNVISTADAISQPFGSGDFQVDYPGELFSNSFGVHGFAVVDLNGDAIDDIVQASQFDFTVLLGIDDGRFSARSLIHAGGEIGGIALADLSNDSIPDLILAMRGTGQVAIRNGIGDGTFAEPLFINLGATPNDVHVGDFNGDGKKDLAVTDANAQPMAIVLQNTDGSFLQPEFTPVGSAASIDILDINGDGRSDIAKVDKSSDLLQVLRSEGDGTFTEIHSAAVGTDPIAVRVAEVSGDDLLDILVASAGSKEIFVIASTDTMTFAEPVGFPVEIAPDDLLVTGAGTAAKLVISGESTDEDGTIVVHSAAAPYGETQSFRVRNGEQAIALVDTADEAFSLAVGSDSANRVAVYRAIGNGVYDAQGSFPTGPIPLTLDVADFNGDDIPDLVTANHGSSYDSRILIGNGDGTFSEGPSLVTGRNVGFPFAVKAADFNNDGVNDVIVAEHGRSNLGLFLGQQGGSFSTRRAINIHVVSRSSPNAVEAIDLNSDGNVDIISGNTFRDSVSVLYGNGDGTFAARVTYTVGDTPQNVEVADINNDDILDIATTNLFDNTVSILMGQEDGTFAAQLVIDVLDNPWDLAVADFNGDGNPDIATTSRNAHKVLVQYGAGDGTFPEETIFDTGIAPFTIEVADVNRDGFLDLLTTDAGDDAVSILYGDTNGNFDERRQFAVGDNPRHAIFADLDLDGVLDIASVSDFDATVSVLLGTATAQSSGPLTRSSLASNVAPPSATYNPTFGQVTSRTDELGRRTTFDVDANTGSISAIHRPSSLSTSYTYTSTGLVNTLTASNGQMSEYGYDNQGRLSSLKIAVGTPAASEQKFEYDDAGNRTAFIDERLKRTEYAYDSQNRLTTIRDADGKETAFRYDVEGNLTETIDARGNRVVNQYDARNRLIRTTDEQQGTTQFRYDNEGNLIRVTDPLGNVTTNTYDARNRLIRTIAADGGRTEFRYDLNDNLISLTDPDGNTTRFRYDARDRLIEEIDPLGKSTLYEYDAVDNLVRKTDRNSRETRLVFDPIDRLTTETWIDADGSTTINSIHYAYDDNSNLTQVYDAFSALSYTYDEPDRVITVDNSLVAGSGSQLNTPMPSVLLTYGYDAAGNVSSVTDTIDGNAGATTVYDYDDLARVTSITQTGSNTSDKHVELGYNELGQFISIERYSAQSDLATQLVAQSSYVYDDLNRLSMLEHTNRSGDRLNFFDFTFDASSRITSIEDMDGLTSFSYDRTDQLVAANRSAADPRGDESYSYDKNGNRISSHRHGSDYETGAGNRLLSDGTYNYEYDNEGNQILRTEIASGAKRAFEYDHRNRLVRVTDSDALGTPTQIVEYVYDALDRRIEKSVDDLTSGASPAEVTQFIYDREDIILQYEGDAGTTTTLAHRNFHGPGIDQVLAQDDGQETVWMLADHLGTVTDIASSAGAIVSHRSFDTFGNLLTPFDSISYGYTGREHDAETGNMFYRARFLDSNTGLFLSEDPLGFSGDGSNFYSYVGNAPLTRIDPYGLEFAEKYAAYGFVIGGVVAAGVAVVADVGTFGANIPFTPAEIAAGSALGTAVGFGVGTLVDTLFQEDSEDGGVCEFPPPKGRDSGRVRGKGANSRDKKQVDDAAREAGVKDRSGFGDFIEGAKDSVGKGGADNFSYPELLDLAKEFKDFGGN